MRSRIATNTKYYRMKKGYNQTQLGKEAGMSKTTISRIERDEKEPDLEEIQFLADALGVKVADLTEEEIGITVPTQNGFKSISIREYKFDRKKDRLFLIIVIYILLTIYLISRNDTFIIGFIFVWIFYMGFAFASKIDFLKKRTVTYNFRVEDDVHFEYSDENKKLRNVKNDTIVTSVFIILLTMSSIILFVGGVLGETSEVSFRIWSVMILLILIALELSIMTDAMNRKWFTDTITIEDFSIGFGLIIYNVSYFIQSVLFVFMIIGVTLVDEVEKDIVNLTFLTTMINHIIIIFRMKIKEDAISKYKIVE